MTRQTGTVYTTISMVLSMRATGEKISNMATEKKVGRMALFMKVNILQEKNMVRANINGMTNHNTTVNGSKTKSKDVVPIAGLMAECTKVSG